jgi:AcrR family transcriptional regulator
MSTIGNALRDAREQLFDAAERVLLRDGPNALTSRAVAAEAGCAKRVLRKRFADFDSFLAELVFDRIARLEARSAALLAAAGTGSVIDNLTGALTAVFGSIATQIVALITFRHRLRARLRRSRPTGVPLLAEAVTMIKSYLTAERQLGRVASDADIDVLGLSLIGSGHLLVAGQDGLPQTESVARLVNVHMRQSIVD